MSNSNLFHSLFEPAIICSIDGRILVANRSFATLSNKTTKWFERKKTDIQTIFTAQNKVLQKLIKLTSQTNEEQLTEEIVDVLGLNEFYFIAKCTPFTENFLIIFQDFSNERRLQSAYKRQLDELTELKDKVLDINQVTRRVTSTLAYKIRAPLSGAAIALGKINFAVKENQRVLNLREMADYLEEISLISKKLSLITGETNLNIEKFNLPWLMTDVIQNYQSAHPQQKDFNIKLAVDPYLVAAEFLCTKEKFKDCIFELLKNAYEENAHREKFYQSVQINIRRPKKDKKYYIEISLKNKGNRIPSNIEKKMFNHFFSTKTGHLGSGLTMAKNLLSQMGATLHFEAENIEFNEFVITVPQINLIPEEKNKKPQVYFISDSNDQTVLFSLIMKENKLPSNCFNDIKMALTNLTLKSNDFVIIDYDLTSFNGLQIARHLSKKFPDINIALLLDPRSISNFTEHKNQTENFFLFLKPLYFEQMQKVFKKLKLDL